MKMDEHARAWAHELVAGILTSTALGPEAKSSLHWEILNHLHEAAERRVEARGGNQITLADVQAVVADMGGRTGLASMFLQTRVASTPRAGWAKRFGALFVDAFLVVVGLWLVGMVSGSVLGLVVSPFAHRDFWHLWENLMVLGGMALAFLYFFLSEFHFGATPGKMAFKLRTVMADGRPLTREAAIIRNIAKAVPPLLVVDLVLYFVAFQRDDQRASDRIANTIVIDMTRTTWEAAPPLPASVAPAPPPAVGPSEPLEKTSWAEPARRLRFVQRD